MLESLFQDIATVVSENALIRTPSGRSRMGNVERAMRDMHYSVNPHRAKQQAHLEKSSASSRTPDTDRAMQKDTLKIVGPAAASKVCSHGGVC